MLHTGPVDRQQEFVLRTLEEREIRFVRLWFTDVLGFLKSVAVAPAERAPLLWGQTWQSCAVSIALMAGFLLLAALWVLVPPELGFSFLAFLPLYCVAIVAGVMSHVPGGLGVFEAVFVYALGDRTEIGPLVGALVV